MALTKKDIEQISAAISVQLEEINKSFEKLTKLVEDHEYSLYGVDRKNGLVTDVKELKKSAESQKMFQAKVTGWAAGVGGTVGLVSSWLFKIFSKS